MLFQDVTFWILSVMAIGGALGVVMTPDLFRAALLLIVVFIAVAGFFILLSAEFLAVVQVLIYVGAISVLFIFAVIADTHVTEEEASAIGGYDVDTVKLGAARSAYVVRELNRLAPDFVRCRTGQFRV